MDEQAYKPIHVDANLYHEIAQEHRFISFANLPEPVSSVPMSAYEYEYKTYYVRRFQALVVRSVINLF